MIRLAGQDRSHDLEADIRRAARALRHGDPARDLTPEMRLLGYRETKTQAEYDAWLRRVLACGTGSETTDLPSQSRPSALAARWLRLQVLVRKITRGWLHGHRPPEADTPIGALSLRQATSEADYLERLVQLLRHRDHVDANPFVMPRKPGPLGALTARIRIFLWQVMRFQVERQNFRQNQINRMLAQTLAFQQAQHRQETEALRARLADVETRLAHRPEGPRP